MGLFLRIDVNIITSIMLFFVFLNASRILSRKEKLNRIFLAMSRITFIELIVEALTCVVNKRQGLWWISVSKMLHAVLFGFTPLVVYLWGYFINIWVQGNLKKVRMKMKILAVPLAANIILSGISCFNGIIYNIDDTNTYSHGRLFILPVIISYMYLAYSCIYVIRKRKNYSRNEFAALMGFPIISGVSGIFQMLLHGALLMWSSTAIGLIVVFIYLQQKMIQIDTLTGAWTRPTFENYLEKRLSKGSKEGGFAVVFIDLDKFKRINDNYGHLEGDFALRKTVQIIKEVLRSDDIIARFGGDEFIILLELINKLEIEKVMNSLGLRLERYNRTSGKPYRIEYSCGYEVYSRRRFKNIKHFLNYVDGLMYKNKEAR